MTLDEGARTALPAEIDRVVELALEARSALVDQRGGPLQLLTSPGPEETEAALRSTLDPVEGARFVGTYAGVIVGYALVRSRPVGEDRHLGVIDELYVEPGARQVGVGAALLAEVLAWCEQRGCLGVDAVALPGDRATKNFFEGFGLVARAIVAHRPLGDPEP